ncbi:MAG: hypothetical protein FWD57_09155 [Polyangiaceae bacterium]|nr:hypothetical protein [Polyangiaceae bacterium]
MRHINHRVLHSEKLIPIACGFGLGCVLVFGMAIAGCTASNNCDESCASGCESVGWGRLMVGLQCEGVDVEFSVSNPDGSPVEPLESSCPRPEVLTDYPCSYSYDGNWDGQSYFTLNVAMLEGAEVHQRIDLGRSMCGRDIAYVRVTCGSGDIQVSDVKYVNPCTGVSKPFGLQPKAWGGCG